MKKLTKNSFGAQQIQRRGSSMMSTGQLTQKYFIELCFLLRSPVFLSPSSLPMSLCCSPDFSRPIFVAYFSSHVLSLFSFHLVSAFSLPIVSPDVFSCLLSPFICSLFSPHMFSIRFLPLSSVHQGVQDTKLSQVEVDTPVIKHGEGRSSI